MLDTRPETLSTSMRMSSGPRAMEHSYEHDYSSKPETNFSVEPQNEEEKVLRELLAAFPGLSLEVIAAAYTEADDDINAAAEVLATRQPGGLQSREFGIFVSGALSGVTSKTLTAPIETVRGGSMGAKENYGVLAGEGMSGKGEKKKKKRRAGAKPQELEPKDAAARQAVEEFLLSMLGEGFQLGQDVVRDVLGYYEGDTQKSLEMLLHMTSTTSGLGSGSDQKGTELKNSSHIVDGEMNVIEDSLYTLMGAFPNVDPAQIVMAFQEHNGDLAKVSNALLLDGQVAPKLHGHQEAVAQEVDCNHSDRRVIHAQLKRLFPAVDNIFLWEVLKSTNFVLRDAHQVLLDAGLIPTSEHSERSVSAEGVQRRLSPCVVKSLLNASGKETIATEPNSLQGEWVNVKVAGTPRMRKSTAVAVKKGASSTGDAGKQKITVQHETYGKIGADDYDCHRQCAKENWSTMQNYFREAASAYSRGERSYATVLSEKGKYYKQLAQEADERASLRIFAAMNKNIENNITIDLHAQHVPEALQVLKLHLRSLSRIQSVHTLTVITGYGANSSDGRGRIKPAVISYLARRGIPWKESNVGCIVIILKDARNKILKSADDGSSSE